MTPLVTKKESEKGSFFIGCKNSQILNLAFLMQTRDLVSNMQTSDQANTPSQILKTPLTNGAHTLILSSSRQPVACANAR